MNEPISIIVMAYERSHSLRRLLNSLNDAKYPQNNVNLIISISKKNNNQDVRAVAMEFSWLHGEKKVNYLGDYLSITEHYHHVLKYGIELGNIIILEDDLYVSPSFYYYSIQALNSVSNSPNVAGISLNRVWFNGYTKYPFIPLKDSSDNYFLQIPYSSGQVFNKNMIKRYLAWIDKSDGSVTEIDTIHEALIALAARDDEWLPLMIKYLVVTNQYFLYPYTSLSSNFGDVGTHFSKTTNYFQTQMELNKMDFSFTPIEDSISIYDAFQEIHPSCLEKLNALTKFGITASELQIDLQGTKSSRILKNKYILTIREGINPISSFAGEMKPLIQNLISNIPGKDISLYKPEDLNFSKKADNKIAEFLYNYNNIDSHELSLFSLVIKKIKRLLGKI